MNGLFLVKENITSLWPRKFFLRNNWMVSILFRFFFSWSSVSLRFYSYLCINCCHYFVSNGRKNDKRKVDLRYSCSKKLWISPFLWEQCPKMILFDRKRPWLRYNWSPLNSRLQGKRILSLNLRLLHHIVVIGIFLCEQRDCCLFSLSLVWRSSKCIVP